MLIRGETFSLINKQTNKQTGRKTNKEANKQYQSSIKSLVFLEVQRFDPGVVYKRITLLRTTKSSLISHTCFNPQMIYSRRLRGALSANNKFDPIEKIFNAMIVSAGNTLGARRAYRSPITGGFLMGTRKVNVNKHVDKQTAPLGATK